MTEPVTRFNVDWKQHKLDIYNKILSRYGKQYADGFLELYNERYDKFEYEFVDYRIFFSLLDDYKAVVKDHAMKWYAIVGSGGTGKTTVAKNIAHVFDPSINSQRMVTTVRGIVFEMDRLTTVGALKAIIMDEPDDISSVSKEAKAFRSIIGKARQQQVFMIYCATNLKDIPDYIMKKISGIFFTPALGQALYFKDVPEKGKYVVQSIKEDYKQLGYSVFYKYRKTEGCIPFRTRKKTPFTPEDEAKYLNNKQEDFKNDMAKFKKIVHRNDVLGTPDEPRDKAAEAIARMYNQGIQQTEIAKYFNVSQQRIHQIVSEQAKLLAKTN